MITIENVSSILINRKNLVKIVAIVIFCLLVISYKPKEEEDEEVRIKRELIIDNQNQFNIRREIRIMRERLISQHNNISILDKEMRIMEEQIMRKYNIYTNFNSSRKRLIESIRSERIANQVINSIPSRRSERIANQDNN